MAEETNILSWTPSNWITVLLMVGFGWLVVGAVMRVWQQKQGQGS